MKRFLMSEKVILVSNSIAVILIKPLQTANKYPTAFTNIVYNFYTLKFAGLRTWYQSNAIYEWTSVH